MHPRIRVVTALFMADTYNQGPSVRREFLPDTWLVFLHRNLQETFFALVSDIPEIQPDPAQRLPEYVVATETFEASTRGAN